MRDMASKSRLTVRLRSSDGCVIKIGEDLIQMSEYITYITNHYCYNRKAIPFNNINYKIFKLVFEWCEQHKYDSRGAVGGDFRKLDQFDKQFFDCESDVLCDIFMAANFLGIKPLMDATFEQLKPIVRVNTTDDMFKTILFERSHR